MSRARVLLVGGNDAFLEGVADLLAPAGRFEVVGRARTGSEALDSVESLRADVVLMDVTLPDMSGFETTRRIKARPGAPLVVLLSFHDSRATRLEAWAAGADGFVPKPETAEGLLPLVEDLLRKHVRALPEARAGSSAPRVRPAGEPQ